MAICPRGLKGLALRRWTTLALKAQSPWDGRRRHPKPGLARMWVFWAFCSNKPVLVCSKVNYTCSQFKVRWCKFLNWSVMSSLCTSTVTRLSFSRGRHEHMLVTHWSSRAQVPIWALSPERQIYGYEALFCFHVAGMSTCLLHIEAHVHKCQSEPCHHRVTVRPSLESAWNLGVDTSMLYPENC